MKETFRKVKRFIACRQRTIGFAMLICEVLVLATYYIIGSDSNAPLWISMMLMVGGVSLIVAKDRKKSRY